MTSLSAVQGSGYRAGRAEPRVMRPGGTRGITRIVEPTNPYNDVFNPQRRNMFLALIWDVSRIDGLRERLTSHYRHG